MFPRFLVALLSLLPLLSAAEGPSKKEILAQIAEAGATQPEWWDAVPLDYPDTLDLSWGDSGKGWKPQLNIGHYVWSVINENPSKWKAGTKFMHFVLTRNREARNQEAIDKAMQQLVHCYHDLLQDFPRAAFWLLEAGRKDDVRLANCYFQMGSRELAEEILKQFRSDDTRHGSIIKLWADLGETGRALKLAEGMVRSREDIGWYYAGYAAQAGGDFRKALECFRKAAAADQKKSGRDWKQTVQRAQAAITAIELFALLDLSKVRDGTYRDSSPGYRGPVEVAVSVQGGRITEVKVTQSKEDQYYGAMTEIPAAIVEVQDVKGVDAVLGATLTSEAIIYATAKALRQGQGE